MTHQEIDINYWKEKYPLAELKKCGASPGTIDGIKPLVMNIAVQEEYSDAYEKLEKLPVDIFMWRHGTPQKSYLTKIGGVPHRPNNEPWPVDEVGHPFTFLCQFCFLDSKGTLPFSIPEDVMLIFIKGKDALYDSDEIKIEWWPVNIDCISSQKCPNTNLDIPEYQGEIFKTHHSSCLPEELEYSDFEYEYTLHNISHYQGSLISPTAFIDNFDFDNNEKLVCCFYTQLEALEDATPLDGTSSSGWSENISDILGEVVTIAIIRSPLGDFNVLTACD